MHIIANYFLFFNNILSYFFYIVSEFLVNTLKSA